MKAVIYTRVSDARQTDGTSLEQQARFCAEWCVRNGLQIVQTFQEAGASAKSASRPIFQQMFRWLENKKNRSGITCLVVDKFDRFSRSMEDSIAYEVLLREWGIKLVAATQQTAEDAAGRFMRRSLQNNAEFDNDLRSERSVRGMRAATVERGRFVNPAPIGYRNNRKKTPSLLVDEKPAELVRGMYERVASGYTLTDALQWAQLRGLRGKRGGEITIQTASQTLRKPIYKGWLETRGKQIRVSRQGDWEPIVEPELWARVQLILDGKSSPLQVSHHAANDGFVLRGLLVCDTCGKVLTGSASKSKNKRPHAYYHCQKGCARMRVDVADAAFEAMLESMEPKAERLALTREAFMEAWERLNGSAAADRARILASLETLKAQKSRLLTMALNELISDADYSSRSAQLEAGIAEAEAALSGIAEGLDADDSWSYIEHCMMNLHSLWNQKDAADKRAFGRWIFPAGVYCSKEGYRTPVTDSFFSVLADESVREEELVALTGIEPVF